MKLSNSRSFIRNQQGSTIIEFAFVAPLLLLIIFVTFEFGLTMYKGVLIDGAMNEAAEQFAVGNLDAEGIANLVSKKSAGLVNAKWVYVNICESPAAGKKVRYNCGGAAAVSGSGDSAMDDGKKKQKARPGRMYQVEVSYYDIIHSPLVGQFIATKGEDGKPMVHAGTGRYMRRFQTGFVVRAEDSFDLSNPFGK